ncbi:MAG: hypothetical protein COA42_18815 [Alteromonadaceae bacterium]|nr:MAG: hypothetical protein COA42_18815 [Alteromonadaceae bacterium]
MLHSRMIIKILLLATILLNSAFCGASNPSSGSSQSAIILYDAGWTPAMRLYQKKVVNRALQLSKDKHGDYVLQLFSEETSTSRVRELLVRAEQVHLEFGTSKLNGKRLTSGIGQIQIPIFNGLLGLRSFLVKQSNKSHFETLSSLDSASNLVIGQGITWSDSAVYKNIGLKVEESVQYKKLFPMLRRGRFDLIPLSILEAQSSLIDNQNSSSPLAIVDDVFFYYPKPTYLNYSLSVEGLGERLSYGFDKMIQQGEIKRLFYDVFDNTVKTLKPDSATIFIASNPLITATENAKFIKDFKNNHLTAKTRTLVFK